MRLTILDNGHSRPQKVALWLVGRMVKPIPGPILTMSYRRRLFGKHMSAVLQAAMRGAREWSVSECELFSAFVSAHNRCHY